jgi:hypothetical protein
MAVVVEQGLIQGIIGKLFKTYDHYDEYDDVRVV